MIPGRSTGDDDFLRELKLNVKKELTVAESRPLREACWVPIRPAG
jgi:hypothetical protein